MGLTTYHNKRNFKKTPEPKGKVEKKRHHRFVVQEHHASHLHYDFRLEMGGVLKSWAIPKGPSLDPKIRRLAVEVEDHPVDYIDFEGEIPEHNYGAGEVFIWDHGNYRPVAKTDPLKDVEKGKFSFVLNGEKLHGEFTLVRTGREKQWLLIKKKDEFSESQETDENDFSQTPDDISQIKIGEREPMPRDIAPMLATPTSEAFSDSEWLFEPKWSGIRTLCFINHSKVSWSARSDNDIAFRYPELKSILNYVSAKQVILDGEIVALNTKGVPDLQALHFRTELETLEDIQKAATRFPVVYYVFDLLYFNGYNLMPVPLLRRKSLLHEILKPSPVIRMSDHIFGRGEEFYQEIKKLGFTGVIAKNAQSSYTPSQSQDWLKITNSTRGKTKSKSKVRKKSVPTMKAQDLFSQENASGDVTVLVDNHEVTLTHLDKVYWPQTGYTKFQLLQYDYIAAHFILPYLKDRPLILKRYPNGIEKPHFYQHDVDEVPEFVQTLSTTSEQDRRMDYILANNTATLLYVANLGAIAFHPWNSRQQSLSCPDWMVIDLDPMDENFDLVCDVALDFKALLDDIGLEAYVKTSGASGLHIYVPVAPIYTHEFTAQFAQMICTVVQKRNAKWTTMERVVKKRKTHQVYLDFLQNGKGKAMASPYSVRAKPQAWVSAPLDWREIEKKPQLSDFTLVSMPERLRKVGDIFTNVLKKKQELDEALETIHSLAEPV